MGQAGETARWLRALVLRGTRYSSQHLQLPVTPVPGVQIPSSGFSGHPQIHDAHTYIQVNTQTYTPKK